MDQKTESDNHKAIQWLFGELQPGILPPFSSHSPLYVWNKTQGREHTRTHMDTHTRTHTPPRQKGDFKTLMSSMTLTKARNLSALHFHFQFAVRTNWVVACEPQSGTLCSLSQLCYHWSPLETNCRAMARAIPSSPEDGWLGSPSSIPHPPILPSGPSLGLY